MEKLFQQMNQYMEEAILRFSRGWLELGSHYLTCFIILNTPELKENFNVNTLEQLKSLNFSRQQNIHMSEYIKNERNNFKEKALMVDKILHGNNYRGEKSGFFYLTLSDDYDVLEKLYYCDKIFLNELMEMKDRDQAKKLITDYLSLTPEKLYAMCEKGWKLWHD